MELPSTGSSCGIQSQRALSAAPKLPGYSTKNKIISIESDEIRSFSLSAGDEAEREYLALYDHNCLDEAGENKSAAVFSNVISPRRQRYQAEKVLVPESALRGLQKELFADPCLVAFAPDVKVQAGDFSVQVDTSGEPRLAEQTHLGTVGASELWDFVYQDPSFQGKVRVAVVDTGINFNHEDLAGTFWQSPQGSSQNFVNMSLGADDDNGHGTHVAGLIGADGTNGRGGAGIAPSGVELMGLKALDSNGGGGISAIINAINYAVENGAHVINMSLGAPENITVLRTTIEDAVNEGVFVVAAAGNDGAEIAASRPFSPAMFAKDIPGFVSVGSVDATTGRRSNFSNFSSAYVEIFSPGAQSGTTGLLSTVGVGRLGNYARMAGTSMAAPLVAGTVAMIYRVLQENGVSPQPALVEQLLVRYSSVAPALANFGVDGKTLDLKLLAEGLKLEYGKQQQEEQRPCL